MKKTLIPSAFCAALSFTVPARAMELSADTIQTIQQYSGNAKIVFERGEVFEITADEISNSGETSNYSGHVVVSFSGTKLEASTVAVEKRKDGKSVLTAQRFSLLRTGAN